MKEGAGTPTTEDWVGPLHVEIRRFDGEPLAENLDEAWILEADVSGRLDRRALATHIKEGAGYPFVFTEEYREHAWGASGAALRFVIESPEKLAALIYIVKEAVKGYRRLTYPVNPKRAAKQATEWIASIQGVSQKSIQVKKVKADDDGIRVTVSSPHGTYRVSFRSDGVRTLKRQGGRRKG